MTISFFASGTPKGQPRPRAFVCGGKARVYDAGTAEGWKSAVAVAARDVLPAVPIAGPIAVEIQFSMPRPKSHYGAKGAVKPAFESAQHTQKPDLDNLAKAVLDAMTVLRFWGDDAQIVEMTLGKAWSGLTNPGAWIHVRAL